MSTIPFSMSTAKEIELKKITIDGKGTTRVWKKGKREQSEWERSVALAQPQNISHTLSLDCRLCTVCVHNACKFISNKENEN